MRFLLTENKYIKIKQCRSEVKFYRVQISREKNRILSEDVSKRAPESTGSEIDSFIYMYNDREETW